MKKHIRFSFLSLAAVLFATTHAYALPGFTYLDDEAEAGGYDVTATAQKLPVEWSLAEQENGDGYRVKIAADGAELRTQRKGAAQPLAQVRTKLAAAPFILQRRGPRWRIIVGERTILEAEDDTWHEGRIGYRGALKKDARVQPVEEVAFDDDFMRIAEDVVAAATKVDPRQGPKVREIKVAETLWKPVLGTWSTTGVSENAEQATVAASVNPFAFKAGAKGANLALAGKPFWSDYSMEVSVKPQGATAIGIAVYAQDARNYLLFHWKADGPMQLQGVVNGQTRVLDETPGGYDQKQWYRLRVAIAGGVLRAFVDDGEVLRGRTGLFGRGEVGLYSDNPAEGEMAVFDDVSVRSVRDFQEEFVTQVPGRWQTLAGSWKMSGSATPADARGALAVMGEREWQDYANSADIALPADAAAGLILHHQSGEGTYMFRMAGSKAKLAYAGKAQIIKTARAQTQVLAETPLASKFDGKATSWRFSSERGYLKASVDGVRLLDAFDESLSSGRAGLYAQRGAKGIPSVASFIVEFPRSRPTWGKVPDLYEDPKQAQTMGEWSTPEGLWMAASTPIVTPGMTATATAPPTVAPASNPPATGTPATGAAPANADTTYWHKGAFWGDGSVRFRLPALSGGHNLNLVFGEGRSIFVLTLRAEANVLKAALAHGDATGGKVTVNGEKQAVLGSGEAKVEGAVEGQLIEVARRGSFIIVRLGADNPRTLLAARLQ
ncbi:MAG: hypothetical protein M3347_17265 [Armatimonadota bacterium]|nr:hypothetical protein [Armatimonadota bacterium]